MLFEHMLPKFLWPEAVAYAIYLKNRSLTCALENKTPEGIFIGKKPDVSRLQEFGTKCWVLYAGVNLSKLNQNLANLPSPAYWMNHGGALSWIMDDSNLEECCFHPQRARNKRNDFR
jgi:hypothetical protein